MTSPDVWPAGIDYDEAVQRVVIAEAEQLAYRSSAPEAIAAAALDAIAPLIAKVVEEAEADLAERVAVALRRSGLGYQQSDRVPSTTGGTLTPSSTTLEARNALAAHEARKAAE